ncbi:DUF5704 domain-containing protein [Lysinibacillus sphaericus]|uniref:DUF5704 domain-containing protein n=1 Tax=Lysinibacillus sphaericus TaxID=1421 RepID=A0A6H0A071_LYSSH|nr:DUF5704 domain-containing protein [Lysinibacillus sphaericus]QIS31157.1 hypothetical protein [Lysinibacillus sphaericus]QPA61292.1 hypothetical protein INQ55_23450 [Lysinibacillus sphaericus]
MNVLKKGVRGFILLVLILSFWLALESPSTAFAKRIEVFTDPVPITGKVYWWQLDNGSFRAENSFDNLEVPMADPKNIDNPRPKEFQITAAFELTNYKMPDTFKAANGKTYEASEVKGIEAYEPEWDPSGNNVTYYGKSKRIIYKTLLEVQIVTGGYTLLADEVKKYGTSTTGQPKYNVNYLVPMSVKWKGYIEEGEPETPDPGGGSCSIVYSLGPDGGSKTKNLVQPSPSGSISSDSGEFDVVKGIPSSEYLRADAQSEEYLYDQDFTQRTGNTEFNNIPVSKTFTLTWRTRHKDSDGDYYYVDHSDTETVDVSVSGIKRPFSYWEIKKYSIWKLLNSHFTNYALPGGEHTINANTDVTADGSHSEPVESHVFPPDCPDITLPSESIDGGSSRPNVPDITGEATAAAEAAIGDNEVENDRAEFKGTVIMDNSRTTTNGPTPNDVPDPGMIDMTSRGLLIDPQKTNYFQSPSTGNVNYGPVFSIDGSATALNFPFDVNVVTVHTPVVIYSKASDDKEHDQRTKPPLRSTPTDPDKDRHAFILDRPFTVTMPTSGQHRNIPGYGNRDYAKYIKQKQVKFPFDVYTKTKQGYYPANTWVNVPVDMETVEFFMPVWVPEGEYTINFRSFAINALESGDFGGSEHHANVTIPNPSFNVPPAGSLSAAHVATDSIEVDVVGRLYDFRITDVLDYNWFDVFRDERNQHTGNYYWVGKNGIDGDLRGNQSPFVLPVRHGSHPDSYDANGELKYYKNLGVKKGYQFKFDFKTKGTMYDMKDAIRITPTFYFVDKDGKNRRPVDVYYHMDNKKFVQVGSKDDQEVRNVVLNEPLRNVEEKQLINNSKFYYSRVAGDNVDKESDYYKAFKEYAELGLSEREFIRKYFKDYSKKNVITGTYGWQILNWRLRTAIGPTDAPTNTMIPSSDVVASEQQWHSEYSLPSKLYVVEKGTNVTTYAAQNKMNDNAPIFLKDGYIIVNFNIESIQNGDLDNPHLQYINAPLMNQWKLEGYQSSFTDGYNYVFNLNDGDVIFYQGNQSSDDDFKSTVTH